MRKRGGLTQVSETKMLRDEFSRVLAKALQHVDADAGAECTECMDRGLVIATWQAEGVLHEYAHCCPKCKRDVTWDIKLPAKKKQLASAVDHRGSKGSESELVNNTISARKTLPLPLEIEHHFTKLEREANRELTARAMAKRRSVTTEQAEGICGLVEEMLDMEVPVGDQVTAIRKVLAEIDLEAR